MEGIGGRVRPTHGEVRTYVRMYARTYTYRRVARAQGERGGSLSPQESE